MARLNTYLSAILFFGCFTSALAASPKGEVIDLQLRWHHQFQFAGYYAALEKGFYQEEGLDVRLHAGDPAHQPVPEVLAGHAQYAEGNSEVLYQRLLGKPLVALAAIFQHSPSVLLTRADAKINSVHDLIGKKVMLMNLTEDADFISMFLNEGIALSQVKVTPSSYNLNDLVTGKVDAFNSYTTNEPFLLQQQGIAYTVIDPSNYRIDFYSDILFTTEDELRAHPRRVEAMQRATLKGWRYAMDHPAEIIDLLINKYHANKPREHLEFEAAEMRKLIFPDLIEMGHMNPGRWRHMADTFVTAGLIEPGYSLGNFIYDTTPKRLPDWVMPVLLAVLVVLLALSSVAYYLHRLNRRLADAQNTLRLREQYQRALLDNFPFAVWLKDRESRFLAVNKPFAEAFGYPSAESLAGKSDFDIASPDLAHGYIADDQEVLASGHTKHVEEQVETGGQRTWMETYKSPIQVDDQTIGTVGFFRDITKRKEVEEKLAVLAHTDALTSLASRGHFLVQAERELARSIRHERPLSVLMMDADFFKSINDRYGHRVGDTVLKKIAEICQATLRSADVMGRVGGEEFAILLPETDHATALEVAERLRAAVAAARIGLGGALPLHVTVSIGVASLTSSDANMDTLLSVADKALYLAKNSGRNKVCFAGDGDDHGPDHQVQSLFDAPESQENGEPVI